MRWTLKPKPSEENSNKLAKELGVDTLIASLLLQRGIETYEAARNFFRPSLHDLHDPFLMKDMDKAVARIEQAIADDENILIYGDYDVDGTTSVALLSSYLKTYYPNVATYIPDRYDEGYGISYKGIDFAEDNGFSLIIALDCGIKAVEKVAYASKKNIDFIICDHHRPGPELPKAIAVLDPKRDDCEYPFKELCGCGVGFKLIQALGVRRGETIEDLILYLDLVATAIGADIVPITGENRILAYHGLKVINSNPRTGFKAILKQIKKQTLTITDVVFIIAPRINAAGRMKHGNHAVTLLTETNMVDAIIWASEIEQFNTDRRDADKRITQEALVQISEKKEEDRMTTVVYHENWHKGVIGIVASRLTETYYRPTLVFTKSGEKLAASARSVKGFDVYNALEGCAEYIEQFGGHKYAAGLTLLEEDYENFKAEFEKVVQDTIDPKLLNPEVYIDAEINFAEITPKFYRILKQFAPFGPGNMTPVFMTQNIIDTGKGKRVGEDKSHLRLVVKQGNSNQFTGIGFGMGDKHEITCTGKSFKAAYVIDENEWQGSVSIQLRLKDVKA
jgi:single-stranded-DNA-specific exonuclease